MKVLHLLTPFVPVNSGSGGALQRRVMEMVPEQIACGLDVVVAAPFATEGRDLHSAAVSEELPMATSAAGLANYLRLAHTAVRLHEPDIVHVHGLALSSLALRHPTMCLQFDYYSYADRRLVPSWLARKALLKFRKLAAVSKFSRAGASEMWQIPAESIDILYNGCHMPSDWRSEWSDSKSIRVSYLGRVCEQKGSDLFGEIANLVRRESGADVEFLAAGPLDRFTSNSTDLTVQAAKILGDDVTYLGVLDEAERERYISQTDIFLMPTRRIEMFGMSLAEAMAFGAIPVCSDSGGMPEVVPDSAFRFRNGDAAEAAQRIMAILASSQEENSARRQWARTVSERFAWDRIAADSVRLYEGALSDS